MKILHVTLGFHPAYHWGGPVKVVYQQARELVHRGHQVTVYCTNLLNKEDYIRPGTFQAEVEGIRVVYFHTWRFRSWPGTLGPAWLPDMGEYLRRELPTFDVVHLQGYRHPMMWAAARAAMRAGVPYVVQPHGVLPVFANSRLLKRAYDCVLSPQELKGMSTLIAFQKGERQQALDLGIAPERVVEIPDGIVVPRRDTLPPRGHFRRKYRLPEASPMLLFLGRVCRERGADLLVDAFARMGNRACFLVIAGPDGGYLSEIQALVQRLRVGHRVHITGFVPGDDLWAAYRDATLYVLPCRSGSSPVTIAEACAMGTPVLTTTSCGIAHQVHGQIGEAVPPDVRPLADAMDRLLADTALRQRYAANTQGAMGDAFSVGAATDRLEQVYHRAVDEGCSRQAVR